MNIYPIILFDSNVCVYVYLVLKEYENLSNKLCVFLVTHWSH